MMKKQYKVVYKLILTIIIIGGFWSCNKEQKKNDHGHTHEEGTHEHSGQEKEAHTHEEVVQLTEAQVQVLDIVIDSIKTQAVGGYIEANGELGVPPQNEAVVTTYIGANISKINVIEGDKVNKGTVVAYIAHPNIISLQTDYIEVYNKLTFLKQDFERQKKLYDAEVGSGRDYQQAKAAWSSARGKVKGYESQLQLLGISPATVRKGGISQQAPVRSPIDGFVEKVFVKSGQYVQPQTSLMEIVNTEHIHADLMVFEKDIKHVKNDQTVRLQVKAAGDKELVAKIYSVGKSFEQEPKALHVHAEIENKDHNLLPGMYVSAKIVTDNVLEKVLPEGAIFEENGKTFAFKAEKVGNKWKFTPTEILIKKKQDGMVALTVIQEADQGKLFAHNGAYYIIAEMKKSEAEHVH